MTFALEKGNAVTSFFMFGYDSNKTVITGFGLVQGGVIPSDVAALIEAAQLAMSK